MFCTYILLFTRYTTTFSIILFTLFSWVAYEKPEFAGHQYLLEEGEYQEWMDWGGYDELVQSLRPVLGVSLKMMKTSVD